MGSRLVYSVDRSWLSLSEAGAECQVVGVSFVGLYAERFLLGIGVSKFLLQIGTLFQR